MRKLWEKPIIYQVNNKWAFRPHVIKSSGLLSNQPSVVSVQLFPSCFVCIYIYMCVLCVCVCVCYIHHKNQADINCSITCYHQQWQCLKSNNMIIFYSIEQPVDVMWKFLEIYMILICKKLKIQRKWWLFFLFDFCEQFCSRCFLVWIHLSFFLLRK